ncbi:hypothetical protein GBAR_LOCUS15963 [Geodia barretti]|uniref:Uncharacterized protein n=1 Tax=Geodia barretti TaxID=519541 RepID=A0AA35WT54_GEOBA|nr:hypothetical protein GBAR_LOCUS15963 [Geodia barretti]
MHSPAAAVQYSGGRKRCISSLQVTYHQEIHRPAPRLAQFNQPHNTSSGCGSIDHRPEEDGHSQEAGRFVPDDEDLDFYGPPSLVLPPCSMPGLPPPLPPPSSLAHWDPPPQKLHSAEPSSISESPPNLPPIPTVPYSPLFEHFRASLQEVMREQFASQRSLQCNHHPHCTCHQYCQIKEENQHRPSEVLNEDEDEHGQSIETSIDSGVCVEATHPPPSSTEEEMSLALIRLQTLAAVITTNLQQEELTS